jgi:RNA polymerase sigma-70 factor (ECF subfamily)
MRGVCRRYVSDEQTVEDVLHDAFVVIFTSFDRLRDVRRAEAWMMAITRNVASKCKERQRAVTMVPIEEAAMVSKHTEQADVRGVPLSEVVRMIDRLPEGYGQVFRLSVFEGMSHKEIATMLGIEPHSSSSQLARAKKMLRKMMQQYWAAMLLLLLMPITFFLLRESDRVVSDEMPIVAEQKDMPEESPKDSPTRQPRKPVAVPMPVQRATAIVADTLQSEIVQAADKMVAQEQSMTDTMPNDTAKIIHEVELPHYYEAELLPDKPAASSDKAKKWSLELACSGRFDEQNRYHQPFSYKPVPSDVQSMPSPTVPSSIDNWTDYAAYLANNPDALSAQTRSVVMRIALNNANRPGDDKILRTSHHQMPVKWSLTLKYRLNHRFALESGLSYSRLTSDFETGTDGRSATEGDACLGKNAIREQQTIHYLGIPMKGIYNIYGGKRWDIYGSIGLTTEMPVHSTLRSDYYVNGRHEATDKTTIRAPWQFSTTFGLGLQMYLTPHVGFFMEPSLLYYLPTHSDIETYRTEHPFSFSLPLGIRFTW